MSNYSDTLKTKPAKEKITASEVAEVSDWFAHAIDYPQNRVNSSIPNRQLYRWIEDPDEVLKQRDHVEYVGLFNLGSPKPPVPLMESHYYPDGQARLRRVVTFYRTYGVMNETEYAPDHLCVELAYLGYLARLASHYSERTDLTKAYKAYCKAHPGAWVSQCSRAIRKENPDSLYLTLFLALEKFLYDVSESVMIPVETCDA